MDTKHYDIIITEEAGLDMVQMHDYIAYEFFSPVAAGRLYRKIAKAIQELALFPRRYAVIASGPEYPGEIRRMVVGKYSIFYFIQDDKVIVTDVIYGPSDFTQRLKAIKERIKKAGGME